MQLDEVDDEGCGLHMQLVYDELIIALIDENDDDEADEYMIWATINHLKLADEIEQLIEVDDDEVVIVVTLAAVLDVMFEDVELNELHIYAYLFEKKV